MKKKARTQSAIQSPKFQTARKIGKMLNQFSRVGPSHAQMHSFDRTNATSDCDMIETTAEFSSLNDSGAHYETCFNASKKSERNLISICERLDRDMNWFRLQNRRIYSTTVRDLQI